MAEQGPSAEQEAQLELQELMKELGPLVEVLQDPDASPEKKLQAARRIMEILSKFKEVMPPDQYAEQFGQLEQFVNQVLGQMEG